MRKVLLIGAGNMGGAMIPGLSRWDLSVVEGNPKRREELARLYPDIQIMDTIPPLNGYTAVLAIKPQSLHTLKTTGRAEALVSILAGVTLDTLRSRIEADAYIRAMPNIAALKNRAVSSVTGDESYKREALEILSCIGKAIWLDSEKQLDIATGIGGSAPAWLALVAEALSDGAVRLGLPRDKSYRYISALFEGTGAMLEDTHPALLKDMVMSPGGTTAEGYAALEKGAVRDAFVEAMSRCYEKSVELGAKE